MWIFLLKRFNIIENNDSFIKKISARLDLNVVGDSC